jgi:hypothetical protein
MAALLAPKVGEAYLDNVLRFQKIVWGGSDASGSVDIVGANSADSDTLQDIALFEYGPGGIMVFGVAHHIDAVFEAETDITIGGTDTDGWGTVLAVAATAAGPSDYWKSNMCMSTTTELNHYFSTASGAINLTYTPGTAGASMTGIISVGVWYTYGI